MRNYCDITSYARVFNILEHLISENFLLRSRVPHAYVTQRVSSHSDERTSSFTELCTLRESRALMHAALCTAWLCGELDPRNFLMVDGYNMDEHLECFAYYYQESQVSPSSSFLPPPWESCPRINRTRLWTNLGKGGPFWLP